MELLKEYLQMNARCKDLYIKNNEMIEDENLSFSELFENVSYDVDIVFPILVISPRKIGYKYWKDAIFLYMICEDNDVGVCNYIYANIATKYKKTQASIERAMRLCFENVMYNISKKESNFVIDYLKPVLLYPHNGELLVKLVKLLTSKDFQKIKRKLLNK